MKKRISKLRIAWQHKGQEEKAMLIILALNPLAWVAFAVFGRYMMQ